MTDANHCWTCGRPRGIALQRGSWSLRIGTPLVPRTDNPADKPAQFTNDLICGASIYRNGGTGSDTHLCDDCLRIGLRAMKVQLSKLLDDLDAGADKDAQIAELTQRLGSSQHRHHNARFDHNRMQDRLAIVLQALDGQSVAAEDIESARWEVRRGHLEAKP